MLPPFCELTLRPAGSQSTGSPAPLGLLPAARSRPASWGNWRGALLLGRCGPAKQSASCATSQRFRLTSCIRFGSKHQPGVKGTRLAGAAGVCSCAPGSATQGGAESQPEPQRCDPQGERWADGPGQRQGGRAGMKRFSGCGARGQRFWPSQGWLAAICFASSISAAYAEGATIKSRLDGSSLTYTRLYCTPDNESHFGDLTVELEKQNFAPPAASIYIGGAQPASSAFFAGFEPHWGARDLANRLYHPTPAVQLLTVVDGVFSVTASDGETRQLHPGDLVHLEDVAPCKGHITVVGDTPGFLVFAR